LAPKVFREFFNVTPWMVALKKFSFVNKNTLLLCFFCSKSAKVELSVMVLGPIVCRISGGGVRGRSRLKVFEDLEETSA